MTQLEFRSEPTVELIDWMPRAQFQGDEWKEVDADARVAQAARVSSGNDTAGITTTPAKIAQRNKGLLKMLMRDRHGSPFEHVVFTWRIETPIFVAREFFRHRIASYNETSARYTELKPVFYVPARERPLVQEGKPGAYTFTQGTFEQYHNVVISHEDTARDAWVRYQILLGEGVAREVARNVLPFHIYTSFYVTMNLRSLLNFLSLRLFTEDSSTPTFPLYEISQVAERMESGVEYIVPQIMKNFNEGGRVAP